MTGRLCDARQNCLAHVSCSLDDIYLGFFLVVVMDVFLFLVSLVPLEILIVFFKVSAFFSCVKRKQGRRITLSGLGFEGWKQR